MPYKPQEEPLLERYVALVSADGLSEFLVHLGDIVHGNLKKWPEGQYAKVAGLLKKSRVPVFVLPGDNEWNDLDDPDEGWRFWTKHFLHFEKNFASAPKARHQEVRPENFAFTGYFSATPSHGSDISCFMPRLMRWVSGLKRMTCTLTCWPIWSASDGWLMRRHAMSVTCSSPSTPPRSTKAP